MRAHAPLLFVLATLVAARAGAAPPKLPAAERETARRLMEEGRARVRAGDLAGAIKAFGQAHAVMHVPTTGYALAQAYADHGDYVEARNAGDRRVQDRARAEGAAGLRGGAPPPRASSRCS